MRNYKKLYPDTARVKEFKDKILNDTYWTGNHKEDNEQTLNKLIHAAVMDYIDSKQCILSESCLKNIEQ